MQTTSFVATISTSQQRSRAKRALAPIRSLRTGFVRPSGTVRRIPRSELVTSSDEQGRADAVRFAQERSARCTARDATLTNRLLSCSLGGKMIRLVLADDHQVFAEGLGMVLDAEDDVEVLGIAPDGDGALSLLGEHIPDVLLLDAHMPRTDLCEVVRAAKANAPGTRVVVLSADTRREIIDTAIEAGADGFLAEDLTGWQVASVLRKLLDGQAAPVTPSLPDRPARDPSVELRVRTLSAREREILGLLVDGHSNRRIAEECFLSLNTVRTHVQNVLVKLGVHSKLEAVAFALEHQVVPGRAGWAPDIGGVLPVAQHRADPRAERPGQARCALQARGGRLRPRAPGRPRPRRLGPRLGRPRPSRLTLGRLAAGRRRGSPAPFPAAGASHRRPAPLPLPLRRRPRAASARAELRKSGPRTLG